jgi:hypothetical protein
MSALSRRLLHVIVVGVLLPTLLETQPRPNFAGEWELVEALASGSSRNSSGGVSEGPRRTTSTTISGAAFNCGRGCTIAHKGQTLTIEHAQLAVDQGTDKSRPTPSVTLRLDGREAKVVDSFNSRSELLVTARWQGSKVRIGSVAFGSLVMGQLLSLDDGHLVVVSSTTLQGEPRGETIFRYRKK